jgi:FkbM family methyltransferase
MRRVKKVLGNVLRGRFRQHKTWGRRAVRDSHQDIHMLLGGRASCIVDGGANAGKTVSKFLSRYPQADIHAFEPIPELQSRLAARFAQMPNVHLHRAALGAQEGEVSLNVTAHDPGSSLLPPSRENRAYWQEQMDVVRTVQTPVVRMDGAVEGPVDVIKLDLQGYELPALQGATGLLPETRLVIAEVEFVELYEGQALFGQVDAFLREQGFELFNFYSLYTQRDGQLVYGDALYRNVRLVEIAPVEREA